MHTQALTYDHVPPTYDKQACLLVLLFCTSSPLDAHTILLLSSVLGLKYRHAGLD